MKALKRLLAGSYQKKSAIEVVLILNFLFSSKSKALAYFRDANITDVNVPITKQDILQVKVTLINGRVSVATMPIDILFKLCSFQRSQDRSWRTCSAELKKNILKLTILREGKVSQVSFTFSLAIFVFKRSNSG